MHHEILNKKSLIILLILVLTAYLFIPYIQDYINYRLRQNFHQGFYRGENCGDQKLMNANPDCICPADKLKQKYYFMCDPIGCPPFYKCIEKKECEPAGHFEIINGECIPLPEPGCGWSDDYIETDIKCSDIKPKDCWDINPLYNCCSLNDKCLDFAKRDLKKMPYLCNSLSKEQCENYPDYCVVKNNVCASK